MQFNELLILLDPYHSARQLDIEISLFSIALLNFNSTRADWEPVLHDIREHNSTRED